MMKMILAVSLLFIGLGAAAQETFEGVGIVLSQKDGLTHVESTLKGSPAEAGGIQPQELINGVDGNSIVNTDLNTVVSKIRGPAGTQVVLTMADPQNQHERSVTLVRIKFVRECFMEGVIQLQLNGPGAPGAGGPTSIMGSIGSQNIQWMANGGTILGRFNGETLNLRFEAFGGAQTIRGYIHNQYVQWQGMNNFIAGYQSCIP